MSSFCQMHTDAGMPVHIRATTQFKTTTIQLLIDRPFDDDYSAFALLPHVLKRGSAKYPDSLALERHLDQLYGASFAVSTHRLGERHVVEMHLEVADDSLLPTPESLLAVGLQTLAELLLGPASECGSFVAAYVQQEQEAQIRAIESVYNDKAEYAHQRCLQELFQDDPFARLPIGAVEQVAQITPGTLWEFYQRLLQTANFQLFITGNVVPKQAVPLASQAFGQRLGAARQLTASSPLPSLRTAREVTEQQPVAQGKLVLAYRTGVTRRDPLYFATLVYNGLLGGFSHSKLFQHVRERASLAYDCGSSLIVTKGLLLVEAGISPRDLAAARAIIDQQLQAMRQGEWSAEEWEKTILALLGGLRGLGDRPYRLALSHFDRLVNGVTYSDEEMIAGITQVTRQQVLAVAGGVQLDTAYFLQGTAPIASPLRLAEEGPDGDN